MCTCVLAFARQSAPVHAHVSVYLYLYVTIRVCDVMSVTQPAPVMYVHLCVNLCILKLKRSPPLTRIGWRGCIGCLIFTHHFSQKSPVINGSCAERDLQLNPVHLRHSVCVCVSVSVCKCACARRGFCYRLVKTHRMP